MLDLRCSESNRYRLNQLGDTTEEDFGRNRCDTGRALKCPFLSDRRPAIQSIFSATARRQMCTRNVPEQELLAHLQLKL